MMMRLARLQSKPLLFPGWTMAMHLSKKGTYNTSFPPAPLASCTFQITVQDPVSYLCIEWNSTTVSKGIYIPVKMLRSESYSLLRVQKSHTAMFGEKSFRASAPGLWNKLPNHIKIYCQ